MLDDQYGVAQIAELQKRVEKPPVITLMQADRGLIENVHDADQSGADLAGEADALGFAAGQRLRAAVQRQIVEPDVSEEAERDCRFP